MIDTTYQTLLELEMYFDMVCLIIIAIACVLGAWSEWYKDTLAECLCFSVLTVAATAMFFWVLKRDFVPVPVSLFIWGTAAYASILVKRQVDQFLSVKKGGRRSGDRLGWNGHKPVTINEQHRQKARP